MRYKDIDGTSRTSLEDAHERHHRGHRHNKHFSSEERGQHEDRHFRHRKFRGGHGRRGERGRAFDYGELRLLVLWMIEEQPRHGYELMRAIEEQMGGSYSPSPGVIYPTLSWLEDMGYTRVEVAGARKSYAITEEGKAFLMANRAAIDEMRARLGASSRGKLESVPAPIIRGMENLKLALRLRLRQGSLDQAAAEQIAAALDGAAQTIERS